MKKFSRILACILLLALLSPSLRMDSFAAETQDAAKEEKNYTELEDIDVTGESLAVITGILKDSVDIGVKSIEYSRYHAAVLMGDGTVRAFFYGQSVSGWSIPDYGQCQVSEWNNIKAIACDNFCTYGLTKEGALVWAGEPYVPDGNFDDFDYEKDEGWIKISTGKGYKDIVISGGVIYALNADGKVDIAFAPDGEDYKETVIINDEIRKITDIIDIEEYSGNAIATLSSSGEVSYFNIRRFFGETHKQTRYAGAVALKEYDGALCAVMADGELKTIEASHRVDRNELNAMCGWANDDHDSGYQLSPEEIADCWHRGTGLLPYVFRTKTGEIGILQSTRGQASYFFGTVFSGWKDVQDVFLFEFALPETFGEEREIQKGYYDSIVNRFELYVSLGIKGNGECIADYHFAVWRDDIYDA